MRTPKRFDWIIGYVFGDFEKKLLKYLTEENKPGMGLKLEDIDGSYMRVCNVPKVCFGLREYKSKENTILEGAGNRLCEVIKEELEEVFGKKFTFDIIYFPDNQYITFRMKAFRKQPPKKMTLKEIEAALGYEVEIVKE